VILDHHGQIPFLCRILYYRYRITLCFCFFSCPIYRTTAGRLDILGESSGFGRKAPASQNLENFSYPMIFIERRNQTLLAQQIGNGNKTNFWNVKASVIKQAKSTKLLASYFRENTPSVNSSIIQSYFYHEFQRQYAREFVSKQKGIAFNLSIDP
jgi:hypothetical protein